MKALTTLVLTLALLACEKNPDDMQTTVEPPQQTSDVEADKKDPLWGRVVRAGLFRVMRSGGVVANEKASTGKMIAKPVLEFIEKTDRIPLVKDAHMSLQYRIGYIPDDVHWLDLRRVLKHPAMTLPDGTPTTGSDYMIKGKVEVGQVVAYTGYGLNENYEMVEGDWTFEIWHEDQKLIGQTFITYFPDTQDIPVLEAKFKPDYVPSRNPANFPKE